MPGPLLLGIPVATVARAAVLTTAPIVGEYLAEKIEQKKGRRKAGEPEAELARRAGQASGKFLHLTGGGK